MSRIACAVFAFFAWHISNAAAGELRGESFFSRSLDRIMPYQVYLPDGYGTGQQHYPVLYLLHGAGGDEHAWVDHGHIKEKADRLIETRSIQPAIIVIPGCPACWWIDGAKDRAETAFWSDLVPLVEMRYRTIANRDGRLVAGLSAGGYGAVHYALKYPDRIAAAAALSPAVYTQTVPLLSAARSQPPFLGADGKFDRIAWDRQNYPVLIESYVAQSFRVPIYLVSGDIDKFGITSETAALFRRLAQTQPGETELRVVPGDHSWKVWESTIEGAMSYIFQYAAKPQPAMRTAATLAIAPHK